MMSAGMSRGEGVSSASKHDHPPFWLSFTLQSLFVVLTFSPDSFPPLTPQISVSGGVNEGQRQITDT